MLLAWMAIPLTRGLYALVDDEDYEKLSKHKWYAAKDKRTFYAVRRINKYKRIVWMHREILGLPKNILTDHRNSCGLDNRKTNLRPATRSQNQWNRRPQGKTSKYKGVSWSKGKRKWYARIMKNNQNIYLGRFDSEIEAAKAYDKKTKELHGEFARLNLNELL